MRLGVLSGVRDERTPVVQLHGEVLDLERSLQKAQHLRQQRCAAFIHLLQTGLWLGDIH